MRLRCLLLPTVEGSSELQFGDHIDGDSLGVGGFSSHAGDSLSSEGADGAGGVACSGGGTGSTWNSKRSFVEVSIT